MNGHHLVLICVFAAAQASASTSDVRPQPAVSLGGSGALASNVGSSRVTPTTSQSLPKLTKVRHRPVAQANIADLGGGVVKEIRATSVFVQERAAKAGSADSWLIALSGFGLVILQLRRKHKSLPQRRIVPYA
jgi:ABC-type taurine transport system substrate-binding protein